MAINLHSEIKKSSKTPPAKTLIEVKNFSVAFNNQYILKDVNFIVKERECLTILGESGAGKTTVLRALIGLIKPTSGEVIVEGQDITKLSERELTPVRRKIAFAFQNGALFDSMSVFDNIALPLREHTQLSPEAIRKRVMKELEDLDLSETIDLLPGELSGGMKKRVGIARSMILKPKVMLYDEPTVSLDPYNTANLVNIMLKLKKRKTTSILVTHDMNVALKISDRIALLLDGTIQAVGTPETLEKSYNVLIKNFMEGIKGGKK